MAYHKSYHTVFLVYHGAPWVKMALITDWKGYIEYNIIEIEYAQEVKQQIKGSSLFEQIGPFLVPEILRNSYDYNRLNFADLEGFYIHAWERGSIISQKTTDELPF